MKTNILMLILIFCSFQNFAQKDFEKIILKDKNLQITEMYYIDDAHLKQSEYKYIYKGLEQIKGNYKDNMKEGVWTYSPSKNLQITGRYANDLRTDKWTYIENNDTIAILNYINDTLNGTQFGYHSNGHIASEIEYHKGLRNGSANMYDENGTILEKLNYKDDTLHGDFWSFSETGKPVLKLTFFNNTPINLENYSNDSSLMIYTGNLRNGIGTLTSYTLNQVTKMKQISLVRTYKDSVLHGKTIGFDPEGKISFKGQYYNGFMDGKWIFFTKKNRIEREDVCNYSYNSKLKKDSTKTTDINYEVGFYTIEKSPMFDGEDIQNSELMNFRYFVANKIIYPIKCKEKGIKGTVYIRFTVNSFGKVSDIKIIKGAHHLLDEEAIRVLKSSPLFIPGTESGIPCNLDCSIPITFRLN
jgi:TonB family protein